VPAALPPGGTRYALYRSLGRAQCRSGRLRKISNPPGFDPWTVHPVASRYTDSCPGPHTPPVPVLYQVNRLDALSRLVALHNIFTASVYWHVKVGIHVSSIREFSKHRLHYTDRPVTVRIIRRTDRRADLPAALVTA